MSCVGAGWLDPHRLDFSLTNNIGMPVTLDQSLICTDYHPSCPKVHQGFVATTGKFIQGREPPVVLPNGVSRHFAMAGRDYDMRYPCGQLRYSWRGVLPDTLADQIPGEVNIDEQCEFNVTLAISASLWTGSIDIQVSYGGTIDQVSSVRHWSDIVEADVHCSSTGATITFKRRNREGRWLDYRVTQAVPGLAALVSQRLIYGESSEFVKCGLYATNLDEALSSNCKERESQVTVSFNPVLLLSATVRSQFGHADVSVNQRDIDDSIKNILEHAFGKVDRVRQDFTMDSMGMVNTVREDFKRDLQDLQ
eukprot:gene19338-112_t